MKKKDKSKGGDNALIIPFGRAARVGNWKLWRSRSGDMESINVSDLEGLWSVRVPSTSDMFSLIAGSYATFDTERRDTFLGMLFTNMRNVCTSASEPLHNAFFLLTEALVFPYIFLSEKEMCARLKKNMEARGASKSEIKEYVAKMTDYRSQLLDLALRMRENVIKAYETQLEEETHHSDEELENLEHDERAQEMADVLLGEEKG